MKTTTPDDAPSLVFSTTSLTDPGSDLNAAVIFSIAGSNPSSPSATVVRAHVHPAPPAGQVPVPESGGDGPATAAPAASSAAPEATPPQKETPVETVDLPSSVAAAAPEVAPPPDPKMAPPAPSTPPLSPETPPSSLPPQQETTSPQQEDVQVLPPSAIEGLAEVDAPQAAGRVEPSEAEAEGGAPQSPSPSPPPPADDGSPHLPKTPEKSPVQDSAPPVAILEPEETSEPADTQVTTSTETVSRNWSHWFHTQTQFEGPVYKVWPDL